MTTEPANTAAGADGDSVISKLRASHASISSVLRSSTAAARDLAGAGLSLSCRQDFLSGIAGVIEPLQSQAIANEAVQARIGQAVSPAISLLRAFNHAERLERRLLALSSGEAADGDGGADRLVIYVDCVSRLSSAVSAVTAEREPAVQRLQDAVEFLGRTKATDKLRVRRLRDAAAALRAVCEEEVEKMRYEGPLDEALLRLQDEYEEILRRLRHQDDGEYGEGAGGGESLVGRGMESDDWPTLGSPEEIEVLRRVFETLASNDCLDICIDIFVKVRYRQVAKALMRLNPDYLNTYEPEEIDRIDWESLESSISLWIEHLHVAVTTVLAAEKHLSRSVLSSAMDGAVWPECFAKISDRIMAVFFRFAEGVALSSPEPQKLFKLLDMSDAARRLRPSLSVLFDDAAPDISTRFRELQKLLVHAASAAFSALALRIQGLQDGSSTPPDAAVPGVVRYAVNYLKCLTADGYSPAMAHVLRTERLWSAGFLSRPDSDNSLLKESVAGVLEALQHNVEAKRERYRDKFAGHLFAMNSYWYMYMRTRGSEVAKIVGEEEMRSKYKAAAEAAASWYQAEAWGPLVRLLEVDNPPLPEAAEAGEAAGAEAVARGKMEAFKRELQENFRLHMAGRYKIPDADLRAQMKKAVAEMVVSAYSAFLKDSAGAMKGRPFLPPDTVQKVIGRLFNGGEGGNGRDGGRRAVAAAAAAAAAEQKDGGRIS
ncbi:hypothetical protein AXF42_Ash013054 [Apostasia shenzhenica]|uniref:Exocyst subunit Exo70 family protein n=1 Tax=Apostasia shenzhenica TaxID=1088818 RepID=A0A2I0BCX6_9ASPA|nr:hypothetical protein AXF42_Ash013054 [Apostasia shenzhenica]